MLFRSISSEILDGNESVLAGYKKFLASGGSEDPIDLLKLCGVDMTSKEPIRRALEVFESLLDEFESL